MYFCNASCTYFKSITLKSFKKLLVSLGYELNKTEKVELGTKITHEFYVKDKYCIDIMRIGKGKHIVSDYVNWNNELKCGKPITYNKPLTYYLDVI